MFYMYFIFWYFKRPIPRTGAQNKNNPGESECVFTLIYRNGITAVSRWIDNRLNCCNWQCMPLFTKSILELLQRLALYKTSAYTSSKAHLGFIGKKNCADLFIAGCFPDTNVAGLDNYVNIRPTHGRRWRILGTRNPLIPDFGLMGP